MGVRRRLYELINSKLPSWGSATLRYEGFVAVLDEDLTGSVRFGKKLGWPLPVWLADTSTNLTVFAPRNTNFIQVNPNQWFLPGSRLRIDSQYDVTVSDISGDRVFLTQPLATDFVVGTEVSLYYHPITVSGNYTAPIETFVVHSPYKIYRGDVLVLSGVHEVELSTVVFDLINDEGLYVYTVTLAEPQQATASDGGILGLRAYPAYESPNMLVPEQPFVFDRLSGVFYEDMNDIREVDTIQLRDDTSTLVSELHSGKNTAIYQTQLPVDMLLFGKRMDGVIKWDSYRQAVVLRPSELKRCYLDYTFAPAWVPGQATAWTVILEATGPAKVTITLPPGAKVSVDVNAGTTYTVNVPMPSGPVSDIQIRMFAEDEATEVRIRSWSLASHIPIRMVSHTTVAHVSGPWSWGSTGAIAKRALRLSDVIARADLGGVLSGGFIAG